ncbi:hypothetical protein CRYUN_Cryun34aG0010300 [Craigia yunnanensis]
MAEIECKPLTQVIIEATMVTIIKKSHSLLINNVIESSPSSILTRLHARYFRINISLYGQAMLWKILTELNGVSQDVWHLFHKLPSTVCLLLWCLAMFAISLSFIYIFRCFFHFHLWFMTKKQFLSIMVNPTSQISVIGNLVATRATAQMGWKENAVCGDSLPLILRPTFFLFFAASSMASSAWNSITGAFNTTSKMFFFSSFLFVSLACRPSLFKKSMRKFNVAWWAYFFPLTLLALAAAEYAKEVKGRVAAILMLLLSVLSILVFFGLMLLTAANTDRLLGETDPIYCFSNNLKSST